MTTVRARIGSPILTDFASGRGTPLVVNEDNGRGYVLNSDNAIVPIGGDQVDIRDFDDVDPAGNNDSTSGFLAAWAQAGADARIHLASGHYVTTSTITTSQHRVHIEGDGPYATQWTFAPTADDTCLALNSGSILNQGSVSNLAFLSDDSTHAKIAIDLVDTSGYRLENIVIGGSVTVSGSSYWSGGTGSIGIRCRGREFAQIKNIYAFCDQPLFIAGNPNSILDIDHFHFQDLYLVSNTTFSCVTIDDGVNLSNVEFDGANPWVSGAHAFYWNDTTTSQISNHLRIRGVRTEQGTDATAHSIYISHNYALQNLHIEDVKLDTARKGVYLRKVQNALFALTEYGGSLEAFNASANAGDSLNFWNCFWQAGSTASLTGYTQQLGAGRYLANKPIPDTAMYVYQANDSTDGLILQGQVVPTADLPAASTAMNGRVLVEDAGAGVFNHIIYAGGTRLRRNGYAAF